MKKVILLSFLILVIIFIIVGGVIVFAKNLAIFDIFLSEETKEKRDLNEMAKLYPENIGDFVLYSRGAEKIRKEAECGEINETLNKEELEIKGTICTRTTIGEYRNSENNTVFVHIIKITKGKDIPYIYRVFGTGKADKLGNYDIVRQESHEIGWFPNESYGIDFITTQEGTIKKQSDGGESMIYQGLASGNNSVTQYFINKFPPETGKSKTQNFYKNTEIGFEFSYPKEWKIFENKIQNGLSIKLFPDPNSDRGSLTISVESKPYAFCADCKTLDDVVSKNIKSLQGSVQGPITPHEGQIEGNRTLGFVYRTSNGYQGSSAYFISDDKLYTVSYFEASDIANRYENKYREITQSFKLQP